jgi:hypothetical protein
MSSLTNGYRLVPTPRISEDLGSRMDVGSAATDLSSMLPAATEKVETWISDNALLSVTIAFAMGAGLGWILKRSL